jgi:predicted Zn-dependent peptidase
LNKLRRFLWFLLIVGCALSPATTWAAPRENFTKVVLKNGITVMYKVMKGQPMVSMNAVFPIGFNMEKKKGIAHLLEHLVFRGSSEYSYRDIAGATNRQGGQFNGFTSFYNTSFNYVTTKESFEKAFNIFNASIWKTNLTVSNMEKEKKIIGYELDMDYAMQYSYYPIARYLYPEMYHSRETLAKITVEDLKEFHRTYYQPANARYVIAGDINPQTILSVLEGQSNADGAGPQPGDKSAIKGMEFPQGEKVEERNLYPYRYQLLMGYELTGLSPKERMALKLLAYIYGSDWKIDYERNQYKIYNAVSRTVGPKDYFALYYLERNKPFTERNYQTEKANMQRYVYEFKKIDFKKELKNFIKLVEREAKLSQISPESAVEYEVQRLTDPDNITVDSLAILKKLNQKHLLAVIDKYLSKPPTTWILVKHKEGGKAR